MADEAQLFRLNQAIAKTGQCSRRQADALISAGRVKVNGKIVQDFNFRIDPCVDKLQVDGKKLSIEEFLYIAVHKPKGVVTTCSDEKGRQDILQILPPKLRHLRPVGRLDMNSEGLILLTNDGDLTQQVSHPQYHLLKRYEVTVKGKMSNRDLSAMSSGVELDDGLTAPARVKLLSRDNFSTIFELAIAEGRNRQIRRMCEELGYRVLRLLRVSIGGLQLGEMTPGSWRYLTPAELENMLAGE